MNHLKLLFAFLYFCLPSSQAQNRGVNREAYQISIALTNNEIQVDGFLDEAAWKEAEVADYFKRVLPTDTGYAQAQTEVRLCYSASTLYIGIICFDPTPGKRPVESLRRDFAFPKNDNFIVFIDTYNDQTNGFAFGISPAGAQWDGIQANGGQVNLDWDTKWRSAVSNHADCWVAEFAIPFRSLRYLEGASEWGINFSRQDLKTGEKSSWAPMPRQFATATLAFTGSLVWDKPLPKSGTRFSIIPFFSVKFNQYEKDQKIFNTRRMGVDGKVILSTSLNLDLTLAPDYSQVEVDAQQTNLDRFELFFPEKRQFYLENSDLFANLGAANLRPFFSRRIGIDQRVSAGARLSGKIGENWRIGLMDIQTSGLWTQLAENYAVATVERKVFQRSTISTFLINKQDLDTRSPLDSTNTTSRVAGVEFNLASANNRWTGKTFYHQSFQEHTSGNTSVLAGNITYATPYLAATLNQSWVGADYSAQLGYIRRTGYYELNPTLQYKFFPAHRAIANHGPGFKADFFFDPSFRSTDRDLMAYYQIEWMNKSLLMLDIKNSFLELQAPFDPSHLDGIPFEAGESFTWNEVGASFTSDLRKPFNFLLSSRYGGFFDGSKLTFHSELFYRIQPISSLAIVTSYNHLTLPQPHKSADFILIGPRLDLTFTNTLFFTGLVQYNNQIQNINLNFRLQWRFAPASDLFLVYTENANSTDYRLQNRGLVLKISYWFN